VFGRRSKAQLEPDDATLIMRSLMRIEATLEKIKRALIEEGEDGDAGEES
jgi:hypothetical protein